MTVMVDFATLAVAWSAYYWIRIGSGLLRSPAQPDFLVPMVAVGVYWLVIFFFFGLYRSWYAQSRLDELVTVVKASIFGALVLFFAIFVDDQGAGSPIHSRLMIVMYLALIICCVGGGRWPAPSAPSLRTSLSVSLTVLAKSRLPFAKPSISFACFSSDWLNISTTRVENTRSSSWPSAEISRSSTLMSSVVVCRCSAKVDRLPAGLC